MRPVAEVGERDDRLAADAQHFDDDLLGVAHRLQRLRQDHAVERRVVEAGEPLLQVALQDVDAVAHAGEHAHVVDLDAVAADVALAHQVRQQAAVAAAQVEHARAARPSSSPIVA